MNSLKLTTNVFLLSASLLGTALACEKIPVPDYSFPEQVQDLTSSENDTLGSRYIHGFPRSIAEGAAYIFYGNVFAPVRTPPDFSGPTGESRFFEKVSELEFLRLYLLKNNLISRQFQFYRDAAFQIGQVNSFNFSTTGTETKLRGRAFFLGRWIIEEYLPVPASTGDSKLDDILAAIGAKRVGLGEHHSYLRYENFWINPQQIVDQLSQLPSQSGIKLGTGYLCGGENPQSVRYIGGSTYELDNPLSGAVTRYEVNLPKRTVTVLSETYPAESKVTIGSNVFTRINHPVLGRAWKDPSGLAWSVAIVPVANNLGSIKNGTIVDSPATKACKGKSRLPTQAELETLSERLKHGDGTEAQILTMFPNIRESMWSSTHIPADEYGAARATIFTGVGRANAFFAVGTTATELSDSTIYSRCVSK